MRNVTIDLDSLLESSGSIGYEIAKKLTATEIELYKKILGLTPQIIGKLKKAKEEERIALFEALIRAYPTVTKRENGQSEYLKKNITTCLSEWRKLTKGDMKNEYMLLEKVNEYIRNTDPKYFKKLSNWLKTVVLEPSIESKVFSQNEISIL